MEQYDGALSAARHIVRTEGLAGMYRGLWPNLRECPFCCMCVSLKVHVLNRMVRSQSGAEHRDELFHVRAREGLFGGKDIARSSVEDI